MLAVGCATWFPQPRQELSEQGRHAVELLAARWQKFSDLRTLADIRLAHGPERQQFTGVLLLKRPTSLRFEALSPMGQPLLLATMHDGQVITYDVGTHAATIGPATVDTAIRLFHLPVEPEDLVAVLAGYAVPPKDLRTATVEPPDKAGPSLEMIGALHRQRVWMDFDTGVVHRIQISGGRLEALLTYRRDEEWEVRGIELSVAQDNVTGTIQYRDPERIGGVDPERFQLKIPVGAWIERLR